jgi:DNA mismatch repair ATPase MutS
MITKEKIAELQTKYPNTIFLNRMDDGRYIAYGNDADRMAKVEGNIDWMCPLESYTIQKCHVKRFIPMLTNAGYKVALCEPI